MIAIIDYGIGNLRSMEKALGAVGADVIRTDDPRTILAADKVVLPGVGAFGACAAEIRRRTGLEEAIRRVIDDGRPFLGVCVGMQLLFDVGEEMGEHRGLGIIPGRVVRLDAAAALASAAAPAASGTADAAASASADAPSASPASAAPSASATDHHEGETSRAEPWEGALKIPHMGWNTLHPTRGDALLEGLPDPAYFYFVHSYVSVPADESDTLAACRYGIEFAAAVHRNNVYGVQFHPEKSQQNGLRILKNFAELAK